MDDTSINSRVSLLITRKGYNCNSFSVKIKKPAQTTDKIIKNVNKPGYSYLAAILSTFRDIDARWLMLGEGEMIPTQQEEIAPVVVNEKEVVRLKREVLFLSKQVEGLEKTLGFMEQTIKAQEVTIKTINTKDRVAKLEELSIKKTPHKPNTKG